MPNTQVEAIADCSIRRLTAADLDRVVEIDREISGQSRRGFFVNRLAASRNGRAASSRLPISRTAWWRGMRSRTCSMVNSASASV